MIVLGMPAHQFDLERFFRFVLSCSLDDRLTAENVIAKAKRSGDHVSLMQKLLLKTVLIQRLKLQTLELQNRIGPLLNGPYPNWGRGRVDTFNPYKAIQFNWRLERSAARRADRRVRFSVAVESKTARRNAFALGRQQHIGRRTKPERIVGRWSHAGDRGSRQPATYSRLDLDTSAAEISVRDRSRAKRARQGDLRPRVRQLSQLRRKQDWNSRKHCLHQYRPVPAEFVHLHLSRPPRHRSTRKVNTDLRISARPTAMRISRSMESGRVRRTCTTAPFRAWLTCSRDPADRPKQFVRGYDVYDQQKVGFVYDTHDARSAGFLYDTTIPGNGNGGHLFGTKLRERSEAGSDRVHEDAVGQKRTMSSTSSQSGSVVSSGSAFWQISRWRCRRCSCPTRCSPCFRCRLPRQRCGRASRPYC